MLMCGSAGPVLLHDKASLALSMPHLLAAHRLGTHQIRRQDKAIFFSRQRLYAHVVAGWVACLFLSNSLPSKHEERGVLETGG
jgi:hypothetical protein